MGFTRTVGDQLVLSHTECQMSFDESPMCTGHKSPSCDAIADVALLNSLGIAD